MNQQTRNMSKQWETIVVVLLFSTILVSYAAFQFGFGRFAQRKARSSPQQFSGDWTVVGIQGDSRGMVRLMPNGRIDSHDHDTGKWWLESGSIHMQWWKADPPSLIVYLFPKRDKFVFMATRDLGNLPSVMQGANVVLTPSGSRGR